MRAIKTLGVAVLLVATCLTGVWAGAEAERGAASAGGDVLELKILSRTPVEIPDMKNAIWTEIQKRTRTRLNVEWIPSGEYTTKTHLVIASGELPEIMVADDLTDPIVLSAIKQGMYWDLTNLLGDFSQYPNLKNNIPASAWKYKVPTAATL